MQIRKDSAYNLLLFVLATLIFLEVRLVGRLFVVEIFLFLSLIFLFPMRGRLLLRPPASSALLLLLVWLVAQIISDYINDSSFEDYARGWASVVFSALNFCAIYLLINRSQRRAFIFFTGLAVGFLLGYAFFPNEYSKLDPWKFGVGVGVTFLAISVATLFYSSRKLHIISISLILCIAMLNIYLGFRSMAGICFVTAVFLFLSDTFSDKGSRLRSFGMLRPKIILIGILGLASVALLFSGYRWGVESGYLGETAEKTYEAQGRGQLGLLLGGRLEFVVALKAIYDSPIYGHGSWATDDYYLRYMRDLKADLGYKGYVATDTGLIPAHSHLLGAAVWAGVIATLFWVWVIKNIFSALKALLFLDTAYKPFFVFIGFLLFWDILFSPYGAERRIVTMFYVVAVLMFSYFPKSPLGGRGRRNLKSKDIS